MSEAQSTSSQVEWRDHPKYPGIRVSSTGTVQTRWRRDYYAKSPPHQKLTDEWRTLTPYKLPNGYVQVRFASPSHRVKKTIHTYAHRMVLEAFVGPQPEGCEARHLNGKRDDNRVDNLAWGTKKENSADKLRHGTNNNGERHGGSKLTDADVTEMRKLFASGVSPYKFAKRFNIHPRNAYRIVNREMWGHVPDSDPPPAEAAAH